MAYVEVSAGEGRGFVEQIPNSLSAAGFLFQRGYKLGRTIGEGSYCKVKAAARYLSDGRSRKMACKVINKRQASDDFVTKFLPRELRIIKHLRHPNIVRVFEMFESSEHVYIFMNICEKGDLLEYIRRRGAIHDYKARVIFGQLVSAVHYLHKQDIGHRDLKCENVFITATDCLVIGDFGFARSCRDPRTKRRILSETFCGSAAYAAPEILQGIPYNPKMYDVWSLGCILFIMLTGSMPFDDSNVKSMLKLQLARQFDIRRFNLNILAEKLVYHMLEPDITRRATISQVSHTAWLTEEFTPEFYPVTPTNHAVRR